MIIMKRRTITRSALKYYKMVASGNKGGVLNRIGHMYSEGAWS